MTVHQHVGENRLDEQDAREDAALRTDDTSAPTTMPGVLRTICTTSSPHVGGRQDHPPRMQTMCFSIIGAHYDIVVFRLMTEYDYYT